MAEHDDRFNAAMAEASAAYAAAVDEATQKAASELLSTIHRLIRDDMRPIAYSGQGK